MSSDLFRKQRSRHGRRHGRHCAATRRADLHPADRRTGRRASATRPSSLALAVLDLVGAIVLWTSCARAKRTSIRSLTRMIRNPILPASIPIRPSSASATITTSPPRPSSGFPACRFIIRAISCTGGCSRARSAAPASSTCSAIPIPAASGRRASRYADGLFWLIYTDVKRYGRTTVGGASGASLRDFHNYLVTSPTHRRRMVRSGLSQQQRLRSVAVPRRRRPQISPQHALGSSARAAIASPESCCRNTRSRNAS